MKSNLKFLPIPIAKMLSMLIMALIMVCLSDIAFADEWEERAPMPTPRAGLSSSAVNGKIYAIGGCAPNVYCSKTVEEYDPSNNSWTKKADMPTGRILNCSVVVNDKIYVIGGYMGNNRSNIEEYDPKNNVWTQKKFLPSPKSGCSAIVLDDKIWIFGGWSNTINLTPSLSIYVYDPKIDDFLILNDIPQQFAIAEASAVVFNEYVYFFAGANPTNFIQNDSILVYNTKTQTWKKLNTRITKRSFMVAARIGNKVYLIGGENPFEQWRGLSDVEVFDLITNEITKGLDMPHPSGYIDGCTVENNIYILGGTTGWPNDWPNDFLNLNQVFIPSNTNIGVTPTGKLPTTWGELKRSRI